MPFIHESRSHSPKECLRGDIEARGAERFRSLLKRAHTGTFHKLSPKHLNRYVQEFAGLHNVSTLNTIHEIEGVCRGMEGKRLTYKALVKHNSLRSGPRAAAC